MKKILLLGSSTPAVYALKKLKKAGYSVKVIPDNKKNPCLPENYYPDAAFSIKYPFVLDQKFIDRVKVPILNFHTAPLPELRGVDTTSWAIFHGLFHGLKRFGITVHVIEKKVDFGQIVLKKTFPITSHDTAYSLYEKNRLLLEEVIDKYLIKFIKGNYRLKRLHAPQSFLHKKGEFNYSRLEVNLVWPNEVIDTFIRSHVFPDRQLPYLPVNSSKKYIGGSFIKNGQLFIQFYD